MKSARNKWILLGILMVVLIYIWWDAFQMMSPESAGFQIRQSGEAVASDKSNGQQLDYEPPKVNPFKRSENKPKEIKPLTQTPKQPEPETRLDPQYSLIGVLREGPSSQAVIAGAAGSSTVLSIGESLDVWSLTEINDQYAVFEHDKQRDTLWLYVDTE